MLPDVEDGLVPRGRRPVWGEGKGARPVEGDGLGGKKVWGGGKKVWGGGKEGRWRGGYGSPRGDDLAGFVDPHTGDALPG